MESTGLTDCCVQALVAISDECGLEGAEDCAEFGRWQPELRLQERKKEVCTSEEQKLTLSDPSNADLLQGQRVPLPNSSSAAVFPRKRPDIMIRRRVFLSKEPVPLSRSPHFQSPSPADPCKQRVGLIAELMRKPLDRNSGRTGSFAHLAVGKRILSLSCPSVKPIRLPNPVSCMHLSLKVSQKDSTALVSPVPS